MGKRAPAVFLCIGVWLFCAVYGQNVTMNSGAIVVGTTVSFDGTPVHQYLGVPYAQPPVGSLRWSAPKPLPDPKPGTIIDATKFAPACPQSPSPLMPTFNISEDCLYLNIWTPSNLATNQLVPVMVWIHGGGFVLGDTSQTEYNGTRLSITGDVIIVTINYRLGSLGFLLSPQLVQDSGDAEYGGGSYGIWDQIQALKWVKQNIMSFGGNPKRVTVFGESAGGMSITWLLTTPEANNLFNSAIIESGPCLGYPTNSIGLIEGELFMRTLGCLTAACARRKSIQEVLDAQNAINGTWLPKLGPKNVNKAVDKRVLLSREPINYMWTGQTRSIPVLFGTNENEGATISIAIFPGIMTNQRYQTLLLSTFGDTFGNILYQMYNPSKYGNNSRSALDYLIGDALFTCPTELMAISYAPGPTGNGNNLFLYVFNQTSSFSPLFGAFHSADVPFVFGYTSKGSFTSGEQDLVESMQSYWTQFAKSSSYANASPNFGSTSVFWPFYTILKRKRIVLQENFNIVNQYHEKQCEVWESFLLRLGGIQDGDEGHPFLEWLKYIDRS